MSRKSIFPATLLCVVVSSVTGCGRSDIPELGTVSGVVKLNNEPLANAIVNFSPQLAGRPSTAETDDAGRYSLLYLTDIEGAVIGQHAVTVELVVSDADDDLSDDPADLEEGQELPKQLPASATDGSILKDVAEGHNDIDIELTDG
jgi:hypothetical protein